MIKRYATASAIVSWLLLVFLGMVKQYHSTQPLLAPSLPDFLNGLFLNAFLLSVYLFAFRKLAEMEDDFSVLLWRVFVLAMVSTIVSGLLSLYLYFAGKDDQPWELYLRTLFYHIEFGLLAVFLIYIFTTFKKLILFEANTWVHHLWLVFEVALFLILVGHFFSDAYYEKYFRLPLGVLAIVILILSVNVRWIPYLQFNQKLQSVFQLAVVLFCLVYFTANTYSFLAQGEFAKYRLFDSYYIYILLVFSFIYAVVSILFLLFNLPTSSEFERKFREVDLFQRLSDSILESRSEHEVYSILLESSFVLVKGDAAWLEANDGEILICKNIEENQVNELREALYKEGYDNQETKKVTFKKFLKSRKKGEFRSVLAAPMITDRKLIGHLILLKNQQSGFSHKAMSTINTFMAQASITIHNFKLLNQLVDNQRLQNELQIAKGVQNRLLPEGTLSNGHFEIFAKSQPATEVGGDYYDFFKISEKKYAVIIADVAGKGISAAFNMAQMKGIFQTLVRMNLNPDQFLVYANAALSNCLERTAFITASYYYIDAEYHKVYFSRAGHCPTLYYSKATDTVKFFENKGLGLGIIRNDSYANYVEYDIFEYREGDIMLLYTDGLIESKNKVTGEQFGFDRLKVFLEAHHHLPLEEIYQTLLAQAYQFSGETYIDDDYTLLLIKF
ncbi:SpoIIE family protein phosphatase [Rapidithrix thailandica]|uniref:SpoIIE family protein phosphatase n=1 Tax=Rapidithrix thailandica TaxID=413964 RepID=A0AAW9RWQ9_9BACT